MNLQEPLQRTQLGFDTFDHDLDVVVVPMAPPGAWKDEDELVEAIRLGVLPAEGRAPPSGGR